MTDHEPETVESLRLKNQLLQDMLEKKASEHAAAVADYREALGHVMSLHAETDKYLKMAVDIGVNKRNV